MLDDVRGIEKAASILMRGIFQSSGQNCIGIERIIALPRSYARLLSILEPRIRRLRVGSSLDQLESVDIGAMISNVTFDRLEQIIADAVRQGARCLVGGKRYTHPKFPRGHYFSPTLVVDVTPSMRLAQEEVFGPICVIMAAASVDDAIAIANSTSYALGAAVFGSDRKALDRVISGVRAGMVSVNDFAVFYAVQLPFGGVGGSGYGRFAGEEGLRGLCNVKSVCRDRFPRLASTAIPRALDYPVGERGRGDEVCKGIVRLGYGIGWVERVRGLWGVMRNG